MPARAGWFWLALVSVGCHSLVPAEAVSGPAEPTQQALSPAGERPAAQRFWEEGQRAVQLGQLDRAIALYEQSLAADPQLARNHLSLAAVCLEKGDEAGACPHLHRYLRANPQHLVIRVQYAELLWRLKRCPEARAAFERAVADAQDELPASHLIHCHSRLMQLAEAASDDYDAHLNRGIGLYLLARERAALADSSGQLPAEGLLCRAAGELSLARLQRPDEARPCWYLYRVWSSLGQRQPALRSLREASAGAPFSHLTPAELRGLQLACPDDHRPGR